MVGKFETTLGSMGLVTDWATEAREVLTGLKVLAMGDSSFLFRFVTEEEALRVLGDGTRWMGENYLQFSNFRHEEKKHQS